MTADQNGKEEILTPPERFLRGEQSLDEIADELPFDSCLIDMVIGLQGHEKQVRPEGMARKILKGRASTVFPAPCRKAVYGETKEDRLRANVEVLHKKFTSQTEWRSAFDK